MAQAASNKPSSQEATSTSTGAIDIEKELVYWLDGSEPKPGPDVKERLERFAKSGHSMTGFQLRAANLVDVDLVNRGSKTGYNLSNADFYRCNLTHAHMFKINLRGASLMKAKLVSANLHCADLEDCNLLGADFSNAKTQHDFFMASQSHNYSVSSFFDLAVEKHLSKLADIDASPTLSVCNCKTLRKS